MHFIVSRDARTLALRALAALALALTAVLPPAAPAAIAAPAPSALAQGEPPGGDLLPFDLGADALLARAGLALDPGSSIRVEAPGPNVVLPAGVQQLGFLLGPGQGPTSPHCASLRPRSGGTIAGFTLVRAGVRNGSSTPAWAMRAFDAAGTLLGGHGEGSYPDTGGYLGFPAAPTEFWMAGEGIARVEVCTHNRVSTFGAVPLAGLRVVLGGGSQPVGGEAPAPQAPRGEVAVIGSVMVPPEGGTATIDGGPLAGVSIEIPAGALVGDVPIELSVGYEVDTPLAEFGDTIADDGRLFGDLAAYAERLTAGSDAQYHPIWYPALLAASAKEQPGVPIVLGPAGYRFQQPVRVTVPLGLPEGQAAHPAAVVFLLGSEQPDGTLRYEVVQDVQVDPAAGTATLAISHFSILKWIVPTDIDRYLDNLGAAPGNAVAILRNDKQLLRERMAQLPQDTFRKLAQRAACSGRAWKFNPSKVPPIADLLDHLGFYKSIPAAQYPANLEHWISSQPNGSISVDALFAKAMELADDDIFQALVDSHTVLRGNRDRQDIQNKMAPYTSRPGADERGIRYHLFGTMMYSFAFEHYKASGSFYDIRRRIYRPELVVTLEEAIISGDIASEAEEWLADMQGVQAGNDLYHRVFRQSRDQLIADQGFNLNDCPPGSRPPATPTPRPGPGGIPGKYYAYILVGIGLVLATPEDVQTRPSCRWAGGGRDCTVTAQIEESLGGPYDTLADGRADLKTKLDCFNGYWGLFIKRGDKNAWLQNNVGAADCKTVTQL